MKKEEEGYTRGQMANMLGIEKPQTVHFWTISGLIFPNISSSSRAGLHRKYDKVNLMECFFIKFLQEDEFSLDKIKRILDCIRLYNDTAKRKKWANFWDDSALDGYYRCFKYSKTQEPLRPDVYEDFYPDRDKKGPFLSLENLAHDAFYYEIFDLGIIKRKVMKIIKDLSI